MQGGTGDDTYYANLTTDIVTELASEGVDSVLATSSYTLSANVENLTLAGAAAIKGTGNVLNNTLLGNSANNTLNGGVGGDYMTGGRGNDLFVVDTLLENRQQKRFTPNRQYFSQK